MVTRPVGRFQYIPIIALAVSLILGGYVYNRTLDNWLTDIVTSYMLGLVEDVNHEIEEDKLHFYDLSLDEVDDFLNGLSQSSTQRRFTIIHEDGTVLGDTKLSKLEIKHLENYSQRPEIISALNSGQGIAKRLSAVSHQEVLYVAARLRVADHEHDLLISSVRAVDEHDDLTDHEHDQPPEKVLNDHEPHSSIYILRLAMPMTTLHSMSEDLRFILYLLMGCSMAVLIASTWFSQRKIAQVIDEERKQQQVRIDRSTRKIELLRQLANMLAACKDMSEAQLVVKDIVPRILGEINGCVSIMRESRNLLEVEIDWGEPWPGSTAFSPHDCWAMRRGKHHLSHDDNQNLGCGHMSKLSEDNTTLCIPLTAHGNTVGVFHLYFENSGRPVSEETKQLAFTLAEHLGLALANLRLQEKLRSQAMRDSLTGLYNRRHFEERLEKEWFFAKQSNLLLSVIMLDLDHFKRFNDNFGHDAGDYVLKEVSNLLKQASDTQSVVCRLGGEEFAIICPTLSDEASMVLSEKIIEEVRGLHLEINGLSLGQLGISAGTATYPDLEVSANELVKLADTALYKAKERGRSQAVNASSMRQTDQDE